MSGKQTDVSREHTSIRKPSHTDSELDARFDVSYVIAENTPLIFPDTYRELLEDKYGGIFVGQTSDERWVAWSEYMETGINHQDEPSVRAIADTPNIAAGALIEYFGNDEMEILVED